MPAGCSWTYLCGSGDMSFLFILNIGIYGSTVFSGDRFFTYIKFLTGCAELFNTNRIVPFD
jgi:hypothetical protein